MVFNNLKINMKIIKKGKYFEPNLIIHTLKYLVYFKVKYLIRISLIYAK